MARDETPRDRSRVCAWFGEEARNPVLRKLLIGHGLIWAALMLGTSMIVSSRDMGGHFDQLLVLVYIPCWWASEQLLRRAARRD